MVLTYIFVKAFVATLLVLLKSMSATLGVFAGVAVFISLLAIWMWSALGLETKVEGRAA